MKIFMILRMISRKISKKIFWKIFSKVFKILRKIFRKFFLGNLLGFLMLLAREARIIIFITFLVIDGFWKFKNFFYSKFGHKLYIHFETMKSGVLGLIPAGFSLVFHVQCFFVHTGAALYYTLLRIQLTAFS